MAKHELRPPWLVLRRPEPKRLGVELGGACERVQRCRAVTGLGERDSRAFDKPSVVAGRVVESSEAVVREQLDVVVGSSHRLEPLGGAQVFARPLSMRDRAVGDLADQLVRERVLIVTLNH